MPDLFANVHPSLSGPATSAFSVTPSDTAEFSTPPRALYVGGDGDLAIKMLVGDVVTLTSVAGGSILPIRVVRVLSTGTTATGIVGLV